MAGFVQATSGATTSGTTIDTANFGATPTAGNLIVVGVVTGGSFTTSTSVTDSAGNTYATIINIGNPGIKLWYAYNISTVANFKVTANTNTTEEIICIAQEFNGLTTTDPQDKSTSNSGTGT